MSFKSGCSLDMWQFSRMGHYIFQREGEVYHLGGIVSLDWSLLDVINDSITNDENVFDDHSDSTQQAGFTLVSLFLEEFVAENFTAKIEKTVQTLVLAERYEAVGPLCRLAIPIYEQQNNYRV
uniref:DOCKER Lobe A domain-containing protein n=1 Tax=Parascaris equorum TaxID=6256 RepID=A0A914R395_PAREQ